MTSANQLSTETSMMCIQEITNYLDVLMHDECRWFNEYGRIDTEDTLNRKTPNYTSVDDFFVALYSAREGAGVGDCTTANACTAIYYKILPKGSTHENCSFLRNPTKFDGYFLDENSTSSYDFDQLCIGCTNKIDSFDSNNNLIVKQYGMYLA
jgi:hypothetical protein